PVRRTAARLAHRNLSRSTSVRSRSVEPNGRCRIGGAERSIPSSRGGSVGRADQHRLHGDDLERGGLAGGDVLAVDVLPFLRAVVTDDAVPIAAPGDVDADLDGLDVLVAVQDPVGLVRVARLAVRHTGMLGLARLAVTEPPEAVHRPRLELDPGADAEIH